MSRVEEAEAGRAELLVRQPPRPELTLGPLRLAKHRDAVQQRRRRRYRHQHRLLRVPERLVPPQRVRDVAVDVAPADVRSSSQARRRRRVVAAAVDVVAAVRTMRRSRR